MFKRQVRIFGFGQQLIIDEVKAVVIFVLPFPECSHVAGRVLFDSKAMFTLPT